MSKIIISTVENISNREIGEVLGMVRGNTIRSRNLGSDIGAGLKSLIGGEIKGYVKAMSDARDEALGRMIEQAEEMGADAIVGTRFATSSVMAGAAEILVYGTAIRFK